MPSTDDSHAYESEAPGVGVPVSVPGELELIGSGGIVPEQMVWAFPTLPGSMGHPVLELNPARGIDFKACLNTDP
jgi:hypothetical protein